MKINDFFKKPARKRVPKTQSVFNLANDKKEQELGTIINNLEAQLQKAHLNIDKLSPFEKKYNTLSSALQEKESAINRLQNDVDQREESLVHLRIKAQDLQKAQENLKLINKDLTVSESKNHNLKKELMETNNNLSSLQTVFNKITNEKSNAEAAYSEVVNDFNELKDGFTVIEGENSSLQNISVEIKEKYIAVVEDNRTLELDCQALLNDNRAARLKIEELDSFGVQLNIWNKKLTVDTDEATSKSSVLGNKLKSQGKVLTEMSDYINTLIEDREDLIKLTEYLKFELKKNRFSPSTTFLSRKIGMPTSKKNIRTEYLGTGNPTMLKFAEKEEAHA